MHSSLTHRARLAAIALIAALTAIPAAAQEVTLKLHQFLPENSFVPAHILTPWADRIEAESGGRIKVERYPSMVLGGKPSDLIDQAIDGQVDVVWTLAGYTPGRFPRAEVVELPFMSRDAVPTSRALWRMAQGWDEFKPVHLLGIWVHGPGVIHSARPVTKLEDMRGLSLRAPSRAASMLLERLRAAPVGLPAPQIMEALSKGVIEGALLPWEVTSSIRVSEVVKNHTEFPDRAVYTAVLMLAMNDARYQALPPDLRAVIDAASGEAFSVAAAKAQQDADAPQREAAIAAGAVVTVLDPAEAARWVEAGEGVIADWSAAARGFDGAAAVAEARAAIDAAATE
ncbi:C4-dicarboxylate ABC transporter [Paracoccus suum]|uniref:C4-dicarboxylate ABC transporter n=1 Tax=Paracoccus suum TaxID=2259340 RepID=A0A344PMW3_9RHOB|nr:TRAP transporter substrate-binding protein [Paracoccus suum]AXC50718.1 C4-dicarboxylate ABC transporter [Paracoccus suum]